MNKKTKLKIWGILFFVLPYILFSGKAQSQDLRVLKIQLQNELLDPSSVVVNGLLGQAISESERGRLMTLPTWNNGELITMFSEESRSKNEKNDWYGEHGGKWLYSAALAVERSGDPELKRLLFKTADYLVSTQGQDGYLGSYSPKRRITNKNATTHGTSWDTWSLSYMVLGLLEVDKYFPNDKYLEAAKKIGELFLKTFWKTKADITNYGTREGMSASIILDPVVELYKVTADQRYLEFAGLISKNIEEKEGFRIVSRFLRNNDAEKIGDGKAYQLIWNLTAVAKLYKVTGNKDYLKAVENGWQNIVDYHLSIAGGPWGGIGKMYELFNEKGFWSPYGFVETCSTMQWIQLNRELLEILGGAKYAQEIEKSTYNALLAAQYPNGENWCYHSFANGRRHAAHFNDCCPSSGMMALEELTPLIYSMKDNGISCNIYSESKASVKIASNLVQIEQHTNYPFDGDIQIKVSPSKSSNFPLFVRIPDWADKVSISVNGQSVNTSNIKAGAFFTVDRKWKAGDMVKIQFPFKLKVVKKLESISKPQGGGDISHIDWFALTRGPLVYATNGLIDGKDRERTLHLPENGIEDNFAPVATPEGLNGPTYELKVTDQKPLLFSPYYEAGGREPGNWRLIWLQNRLSE